MAWSAWAAQYLWNGYDQWERGRLQGDNMAIKIIDADDLGKDGFLLTADLDADNPEDVTPDSDRLISRTYGSFESSKINGETKNQYLNRIRGEFRLTARDEASKRTAAKAPRTKVAALVGQDIT